MEDNFEGLGKIETFDSPEALAASMDQGVETESQPVEQAPQTEQAAPTIQETVAPAAEGQPTEQAEQAVAEPQQEIAEPVYSQQEPSSEEIEAAVIDFLSQRAGREITSIDDFLGAQQSEAPALDERISAIAKFVEDTGRAPEDWFRYQSLNPEGMDDMTAIQIDMANNYPNLSYEELNLLIGSKYKLDPDVHTDEEIRLSQLQLKIDGGKAKAEINRIRDSYSAPEVQQAESQDFIDDNWISQMSSEVDALEGLEFDLMDGKTLEFGLDEGYKNQLKSKNTRLNEFFNEFVDDQGNWDFDRLSSHQAVVDNIDKIVKAAYTRGLGDGQKNLLNTAANVSTNTPKQNTTRTQDTTLSDQLKQAFGQQGGFGFI
jgi:hypothetical protein